MAKNVGTLISAAIRPNDSNDPIATAYASEIRGGFHTVQSSTERNSIITERREWGMMCYVIDDNKTYQLTYNYLSTDILDNSNWKEFSGTGGGGNSTEWLDSVLSVTFSQPISPYNGDRYLVGRKPSDIISWGTYSDPGFVAQWNSTLTTWDVTYPSDGMSVRIDNEDNSIYRYEGIYGISGSWQKEMMGQIRSINAVTSNGASYSSTMDPPIDFYVKDMIFLTQFATINSGATVSLNINGLGEVLVKKPSVTGLVNLLPNEIETSYIYSLTYDGTYFQLVKPYSNDSFDIKYYIQPDDYIIIPQYYQYWVYGDLTVAGYLENNGNLIVMNGGLVMAGGTVSNYGSILLTTILSGSFSTTYNDTDTIQFTSVGSIYGPSVSATIIDGSITQSKLNITNPQTGTGSYFLSYTSSGQFLWTDASTLTVQLGENSGLTYSSGQIIIDSTIEGNGLSFSGGVLSVDASEISGMGLTSNGNNLDIVLETNGGLTFSSNSIGVMIDGSTIVINGNGELSTLSGASSPIYEKKISLSTSGDYQNTGFTLSYVPNDYSRIQIFINGQIQILGDGTFSNVDCYFSTDGNSAKNLSDLNTGDGLYWNSSSSGFNLTTSDSIYIIYES